MFNVNLPPSSAFLLLLPMHATNLNTTQTFSPLYHQLKITRQNPSHSAGGQKSQVVNFSLPVSNILLATVKQKSLFPIAT